MLPITSPVREIQPGSNFFKGSTIAGCEKVNGIGLYTAFSAKVT